MKISPNFFFLYCLKVRFISADLSHYVVSGNVAQITDFPFSVFLYAKCVPEGSFEPSKSPYICGGSILNQNLVLTAAHCVYGCGRKSVIAVTVSHSKARKESHIRARSYYVHENYDEADTVNDISIVKVNRNFTYSLKVKRIILGTNIVNNAETHIAGWGIVDEAKPKLPGHLRYATAQVMPLKWCREQLDIMNKRGSICTKALTGYASKGDSGSALVVDREEQVGIVSYKSLHAKLTHIVVYTDVTYYKKWIIEVAHKLSCA